jgi:hypothetical protein
VFWVEFEFFSFCFPGCRTCGPFVDAETTNMFFFPGGMSEQVVEAEASSVGQGGRQRRAWRVIETHASSEASLRVQGQRWLVQCLTSMRTSVAGKCRLLWSPVRWFC